MLAIDIHLSRIAEIQIFLNYSYHYTDISEIVNTFSRKNSDFSEIFSLSNNSKDFRWFSSYYMQEPAPGPGLEQTARSQRQGQRRSRPPGASARASAGDRQGPRPAQETARGQGQRRRPPGARAVL